MSKIIIDTTNETISDINELIELLELQHWSFKIIEGGIL